MLPKIIKKQNIKIIYLIDKEQKYIDNIYHTNNEINNLKSEDYIEEINRSPYREDGKPTPAGKRKAKQFILDNQRTLKALLKNYYQVSMDQEAIDH